MRVEQSIWEKLSTVVYVLLAIAGLLIIGLWYLPVIQKNERMRREILKLDTDLQKEEAEGRNLRSSIEALKDPKNVERLARQRLGYAKPGETVIRFEMPSTNTP